MYLTFLLDSGDGWRFILKIRFERHSPGVSSISSSSSIFFFGSRDRGLIYVSFKSTISLSSETVCYGEGDREKSFLDGPVSLAGENDGSLSAWEEYFLVYGTNLVDKCSFGDSYWSTSTSSSLSASGGFESRSTFSISSSSSLSVTNSELLLRR